MATQFQIEFVEHVEEAIKGLSAQNRTPPTISAIMENSGHGPTDLFAIVTRLKESGDKELLSRLRSVFEKARKMPLCLEDVKPMPKSHKTDIEAGKAENVPLIAMDGEELEFRYTLPAHEMARDIEKTRIRPAAMKTPEAEDQVDNALFHILSILKPLSRENRTTVISTAMRRYGVGE